MPCDTDGLLIALVTRTNVGRMPSLVYRRHVRVPCRQCVNVLVQGIAKIRRERYGIVAYQTMQHVETMMSVKSVRESRAMFNQVHGNLLVASLERIVKGRFPNIIRVSIMVEWLVHVEELQHGAQSLVTHVVGNEPVHHFGMYAIIKFASLHCCHEYVAVGRHEVAQCCCV